jgi:hypothetical protein
MDIANGVRILELGRHLHWDACFKAKLRQRKGYTQLYDPPPNNRYIIPGDVVLPFLKQEDSRRSKNKTRVCHDFTADETCIGKKKVSHKGGVSM